MMKQNRVLFIILLFMSSKALAVNDRLILTDDPPKRLSEYNFFLNPINQSPNEQVVPYALITALFSDYSEKHRFVYVPNGIFATIPIETPSRMTNRQIYEVIGIRYDDIAQMESIIKKVEALLASKDDIDQDQPCRVYFDLFNASSLDFVIWAFSSLTDAGKFKKFKGKLLLDIAQIIDDHGAEIAYPTQTLHIQKTE